jgi:hypothetical protein
LRNNKGILILLLALILASCGGAKYNYNFEKGKNINFNDGKWILNKTYTNYKNNDAYSFAKNEFEDILGDSLFELIELRKTKLISNELPLNPSKKQLEEIQKFTNCDFLINIESKILQNQMGSIATHSTKFGKVTKYNEASTTIKIYDLNSLEIISEATSIGTVKVSRTSEDKKFFEVFEYTASGMLLAINSIKKLIRKYDKYQKE